MGRTDVIDLSYLEDMTGGDNEVMIEMINLLIEETPKHLDNIKQAQDEKNWTQLRSEAHKVKPMFSYVGLSELNQICKELENNSRRKINLQSNPELISRLEDGFNEIVDGLKQKIKELS